MPITRVGTNSVTVPAGSFSITPAPVAGVAAGDLLICTESHGRSGGSPHTATTWAGWTTIYVGTTGNALNTAIIYRIADGTAADAPPAIQWSGNGAAAVALSVAYRGVSSATPFLAQQTDPITTTGTELAAAALNNSSAGIWGLYFGTYRGVVSPASFTPPTGLTEMLDVDAGLGSTNNSVSTIADSAGDLGPGTYQWTGIASASVAANAGRVWAALINTASVALTVTPNPIFNEEIYNPTARPTVTAAPGHISSPPQLYAPTVAYPGLLNPTPIADGSAMYAPAASSTVTATPGVAGGAPVVYNPTPPLLVGPGTITDTSTTHAPAVTLNITAAPEPIVTGPTVRAPAYVPQARDLVVTVAGVARRALTVTTDRRTLTITVRK